MIKGIQIIGMFVGLYLITQSLVNWKRKNYGSGRTIIEVTLWFVMVILFFNPSSFRIFLPFLTTQDVIMSVLVIGILISYILINQLHQQLYNIENRITKLAQNIALHNYFNEEYLKKEKNELNE